MQPPWPDAIYIGGAGLIDCVHRLADGLYSVQFYYDQLIVDAQTASEYTAYDAYTAHNCDGPCLLVFECRSIYGSCCLDGVDTWKYAHVDNEMAIIRSVDLRWMVFRAYKNELQTGL